MTRSLSYARKVVLIVGLALALTACYRLPTPPPEKISVAAVVLDLSTSTDTSTRCNELIARVRSYLDMPDTDRWDIVAFGTSDETTDAKPVVLVPWKRYEKQQRLYGKRQRQETRREAWLTELGATCQQGLRSTRRSPIYAGITTAVESVAAHCAELKQHRLDCSARELAIHSDMEENAHEILTRRLDEVQRLVNRGRKITKRPVALPRVDLSGFTSVVVCGAANHFAQSDGGYSLPALRHVWGEVIDGELPAFDGACPQKTASSSPLATKGGKP